VRVFGPLDNPLSPFQRRRWAFRVAGRASLPPMTENAIDGSDGRGCAGPSA